jgi:DNA primase
MNEIKTAILEKVNITDVIGEYVTLKKRGRTWLGLCPFHTEKTESFTVWPDNGKSKGSYKCFGCGKSGDLFSFIQEHEGLSFWETLVMLANKHHIPIPQKETDEQREKRTEKEALRIATRWALDYLNSNLTNKQGDGYKYLKQRGYTDATIKEWNIGYSINSWTDICEAAKKAQISIELLEKCGFVKKKEDGQYIDRLIDRVFFGITDMSGNPTGFTARITKPDPEKKWAKYINSENNGIFNKSLSVFGIAHARKGIQETGECIITEGTTDVISLWQAGVRNVVALLGTSHTGDQFKVIGKLTRNVMFLLDGDKAGIKAADKDITTAMANGFNVRITILPDGHDPDSFIRTFAAEHKEKAAEKFTEYTDKFSKSIIDFKAELLLPDGDKQNLDKTSDAIKEIVKLLANIESNTKRELYIKNFAAKTGLGEREIKKEIASLKITFADEHKPGIYLLKEATEFIKESRQAIFYTDFTRGLREHLNTDKPNIIVIKGQPSTEKIQELRLVCEDLHLADGKIEIYDAQKRETETIILLKTLTAHMFNITLKEETDDVDVETGEVTENIYNFTDYYCLNLIKNLKKHDSKGIQKAIEKMAELVSYHGDAEQSIKINYIKGWFKDYDITFNVSDIRKVMQPYLKTQKEHRKQEVTIEINNPHNLNHEQLQDLNHYGLFYKDNEIWYSSNTGGVKSKSNFVIYPIIHTESSNSNEARKIFKLIDTFGHEKVIDITANELNVLVKFMVAIESKGNYKFEGDLNNLKKLKSYLYDRTVYSYIIKDLGWQTEGFWAWADGVQTIDKQFFPINEYGIVKLPIKDKEKSFYIKPFSKLYSDDKNVFINERKFRHMTSDIKFKDWLNQFIKVYGDKAHISIAGFLTALFSDYIFARLGNLPLINLFGPKGTGKTEQAKSILSLFGEKQNEINMRKVTPYAAAHSLRMFINAFVLFDEYKNNISFEWIEFMKAIFNRQPRLRGTIQEGVDVMAIPVHSMVFMCGQEMPTADVALLSRCVFLSYHNPQHTEQEKNDYNKLKELDNIGKTHFVDDIICYRQIIETGYMDEFYKIEKEISNECEKNTDDRVIRNYATLITTYKLLQDVLGIEVKYEKLKEISVQCIKEQMSVMSSTNELGLFWSIFQNLIDRGILIRDANFKKKEEATETLEFVVNGKRVEETREMKNEEGRTGIPLLYIRWIGLYQLIAEAAKRSGQDILPENTLRFYLQNDKSFIGYKPTFTFGKNKNQALVFDYNKLCKAIGFEISTEPLHKEYRDMTKTDSTESTEALTVPVNEGGLPF